MKALLFCVIKEFNTIYSGRIYQIKLLSGNLSVGDRISLFGVEIAGHRDAICVVTGEIKQIRHLNYDTSKKEITTAQEGDIVTINIKSCQYGGKRVDKSSIIKKSVTFGMGEGALCEFVSELELSLLKQSAALQEKLAAHLARKAANPRSVKTISLLWFGKKVTAEVLALRTGEGGASLSLRVAGGKTVPMPKSAELRQCLERVVIRDVFATRQRGRGIRGEPVWRYYPGRIVFGG